MAPQFNFLAGEGFTIADLAGSGLGFFGPAGFGASVQVGEWQGRSFITNANGTVQGPEVDNCQVLKDGGGTIVPTGVIVGQTGSGIPLRSLPNYLATLNIRFTNDTPCRTQNTKLRIYDRTDPNNPASGVTTAVAEIVHPDTAQSATGSGSASWNFFPATGATPLALTSSPGTSGLSPSGTSTIDSRHDWYVALSASPDSIGSKTLYGLYVSTEFL